MKYHLYFDTAKCSACGACALACMDQNDIDASCGHQPFRHTYTQEGVHGDLHFFSTACMHCEDAPCVMGCPVGCLYKDEETGFTLYDNTNCIGCHSCAMACPYGVPTFGDDGKMRKCDACIERQKAGLLPACVKVCPTGALTLLTEEGYLAGEEVTIRETRLDSGNVFNCQYSLFPLRPEPAAAGSGSEYFRGKRSSLEKAEPPTEAPPLNTDRVSWGMEREPLGTAH